MSRQNLTAKQHAFLSFLRSFVDKNGVWPTYREICNEFGYRSPNSAAQYIRTLRRKGFLKKDPDGYRFIDKNTDQAIHVCGRVQRGSYERRNDEPALSLPYLFSDFPTLSAVALDETCYRSSELANATYVLIDNHDEMHQVDIQVVVYKGKVHLAAPMNNGSLQIIDNERPVPITDDAVQVLGTYAGHAGAYGIVRRQ